MRQTDVVLVFAKINDLDLCENTVDTRVVSREHVGKRGVSVVCVTVPSAYLSDGCDDAACNMAKAVGEKPWLMGLA